MAKYDPLRRFLRRQRRRDEITLSFGDIERILGAMLPKAACRADWWGNTPEAGPQSRAWLEAEYRAALQTQETVIFQRTRLAG